MDGNVCLCVWCVFVCVCVCVCVYSMLVGLLCYEARLEQFDHF